MEPNDELREFLRSRRARLQPADVGIEPTPGHRRVPGLRREELARVAGVSPDYYMRLEQGRGANVSETVLEAVARALQLNETERVHLFDLAQPARVRRRAPVSPQQRVRPGVRLLIDAQQTPAFVIGRRLDILASNWMARALMADFDTPEPTVRNHARWIFLDPGARELSPDWEAIARDDVAVLRLEAGRFPDDRELSTLVGELSVKSELFRRWWADHDVLRRSHGVKRFRHPLVGDLEITYEALKLPDDPEQTIFIYNVEPGSRSEQAMRLLASLTELPLEAAVR